jgi:hypothetical protein
VEEVICPGCGLEMPRRENAPPDGYYNTSPECWSVYSEVLAAQYSNRMLFAQVHQLSVDSYAVQHAGGPHPDKSVDVHLAGLYLVLERGIRPTAVPPVLQRIAAAVDPWPHFTPPAVQYSINVSDVALVDSTPGHIEMVKRWAAEVWSAWSMHHADVARYVDRVNS